MPKCSNEFQCLFSLSLSLNDIGGGSGSADGSCLVDDLECTEMHDRLGMEAIKSLHEQLDDDDNGNIDLTESDDVSGIANIDERRNIFNYWPY